MQAAISSERKLDLQKDRLRYRVDVTARNGAPLLLLFTPLLWTCIVRQQPLCGRMFLVTVHLQIFSIYCISSNFSESDRNTNFFLQVLATVVTRNTQAIHTIFRLVGIPKLFLEWVSIYCRFSDINGLFPKTKACLRLWNCSSLTTFFSLILWGTDVRFYMKSNTEPNF